MHVRSHRAQVCEIQVWAQLLNHQPLPRYGASAVGFQGTLMRECTGTLVIIICVRASVPPHACVRTADSLHISSINIIVSIVTTTTNIIYTIIVSPPISPAVFGGTDANGFKLNDMRIFDMVNKRWLPPQVALGSAPTPRSAALLFVPGNLWGAANNNRVLIFGGVSSTVVLSDAQYFVGSPCPPLVYPPGALTITNGHSGTYSFFPPSSCAAPSQPTNGNRQLVCDASTGLWQGLYNLETGLVCLPPPPSAGTVTSVTALSSTSAVVNFNLPAGSSFGLVSAAPDPFYIERFASYTGPADFATAWRWFDPTTLSMYNFNGGQVSCTVNCVQK